MPVRRWLAPPATGRRWPPRSAPSHRAEGITAFVVGAMLGSFAFHWRSDRARAPPGRADRAGRRAGHRRPRSGPRSGRGPRRCRLAGPDAEHRPVEPQEPRVARRPGRAARDRARPRRPGLGRAAARRRGLRRHRRRRAGLGHPAPADPPRLRPREGQPAHPHGGAGRQGHHLRHRWSLDQARSGDGHHEARHDRRCRRDGDAGRAGGGRLPGAGRRPGRRRGERRERFRAATRRRGAPLRRAHQRGHQHRRRGSPGPGRRAGVRGRRDQACRRGRRRHPDRGDQGGARAAARRHLRQRRRPGRS